MAGDDDWGEAEARSSSLKMDWWGDASDQPHAHPITLSEEEKDAQRARTEAMRAETGMRQTVSWIITLFFSVLNIVVVGLIFWAAHHDVALIREQVMNPADRLITEEVFMALIAGTVAQIAAILLIITKSLFPHRPPDTEPGG